MSIFSENLTRPTFTTQYQLREGEKPKKIKNADIGHCFTATAFYISEKGKYGKSALMHTTEGIFWLPTYMVQQVEKILNNQAMIDAVNNGECIVRYDGVKISKNGNEMAVVTWL